MTSALVGAWEWAVPGNTPQLLDDRVLLVDEHQVMGIVDHVHLRVWRLVSADDRQDGMAAFGQPFDATAATQPS